MKEIYVRLDKCNGCRACEIACAVEHSAARNLFAAIFESPRPHRRLYVEPFHQRGVPILCRQCEDAPCLAACISGAIWRDQARGGVVMQRGERCIGCWTCIMVCPYGVIGRQQDGRRIALKCDLCPDRETPACVAACPTRALVYTEAEAWAKGMRQEAATTIAAAVGR